LKVVFAGLRRSGRLDLEAIETATRAAMHRAGAGVLNHLLRESAPVPARVACECGQSARYREKRSRNLLTAVGPVRFERAYYCCDSCHRGQSPRDRELDVLETDYSPGVRRMMAVVGSDASFDQGREQMELLAGLAVTRKAVERHAEAIGTDIARREQAEIQRAVQLDLPHVAGTEIPVLYIEMDGTGVPVTASEAEGRKGKNGDQPAHTREVKLGCVFTQTTTDQEGRPMRDNTSTTYAGAIETAEEFGRRMYRQAWQRGWSRAAKKVIIADGAIWIWNIADREFPGAIQIVDLYHAREHLWVLAGKLLPTDHRQRKRWVTGLQRKLDAGKVKSVVRQLRSFPASSIYAAELLRIEADYFERNAERLRYPDFRRQKLFVGSGVIEAACKTVIAQRLKQSGMFWTLRGANAIIALRCCRFNREFEDYWSSRRPAA
jgi:Uncharacterised protein family (UPF0236)